MDLAGEKRRARSAAAALRSQAHPELSVAAAQALSERGLPFIRQPAQQVVSAFHPYQSEIDPLRLLGRLAAEGWTTALPVVIGKGLALVFRAWRPGEPTVSGAWDIRVPPPEAADLAPDVLLVPMLAFDRFGYRLGYGGGFYDRTLKDLRDRKEIVAVGIAYAAQEMPHVPHGDDDQRLDWIMTERETLRCD